ncbi:MAG: hypothetical protein IH984_08630 [Planctomycetes bacterium]|nr:hypothetical protein [Planctomycetota bacterium]
MATYATALTINQILQWADAHNIRTGKWPISRSGPIYEQPERTWEAINSALAKGGCNLPGGDSLAQVLARRRGVKFTRRSWPELTRAQILKWADYHLQCTGHWPDRDSGPVRAASGISWVTVDRYLKQGNKTLPGGLSLAKLLRDARNVWDGRGKPRLTTHRILKWAKEHFDATGHWPVTMSGKMIGRNNEDWAAIDMALRHGRRGLTGISSLSKLLTEHFGARYNPQLAQLSVKQILKWVDAYYQRLNRWPSRKSGPILGAPGGITWGAIDSRLRIGGRGLEGGLTLAKLLDERRRNVLTRA